MNIYKEIGILKELESSKIREAREKFLTLETMDKYIKWHELMFEGELDDPVIELYDSLEDNEPIKTYFDADDLRESEYMLPSAKLYYMSLRIV